MAFNFVSPANRTAWLAASNQEAQLAIVTGAFPGSVELRYYSAAGTLLDTVTHSGWDLSATNPRYLSPRGISARSFAASAAAAYVIAAVPGGAEILRADVALAGNVAASRRTNLGAGSGADGLRIVANSALPVDGLPTWLAGAAVNQWVEIAGTSGAGGAEVDPWGAFAVDPLGRIFVAASGGHNDSPDNRVVMCNLMANSPSWTQLEATSASFQPEVSHYSPDGHPTSRHLYVNSTYVPSLDRIFLVGAQAVFGGSAPSFPSVDAYHVSGLAWDLAGTYTDVPGGVNTYVAGAVYDGTHIWTDNLRKYNPVTDTWSVGANGGRISVSYLIRPWSYDSTRQQLFGLAFGDGRAIGGTTYRCSRVPTSGSTEIAVTINASSALTDFVAEAGGDAGMDYDPENDRHLYYTGQTRNTDGSNPQPTRSGKVYAATRVSDNVYNLSVLSLTGTPPSATIGAGVNGRFKYIPRLKGFILLPSKSSNLWFFRVA